MQKMPQLICRGIFLCFLIFLCGFMYRKNLRFPIKQSAIADGLPKFYINSKNLKLLY